jgi:dipeptidyl aminopeptidase/acylaminoacyl peptidase
MFIGTKESSDIPLENIRKASNVDAFLVRKMKVSQCPNYFLTKDFKKFEQLTNVNPEKEYNWLFSELINYKTLTGRWTQGILYKPENFDLTKKYPIIFNYYERRSESLHGYLEPALSAAELNIPYYVSNGYLVFTPDIYYQEGTGQGPGCYDAVVSAAEYMSKFKWVDARHMGINGHSRGGFETDYLITHTKLFAAAISASGYCDALSLYSLGGMPGRKSGGEQYEWGHQRINGTLWEKQKVYFDNSPLLKADKVGTPLLMMNNQEDGQIPFTQGISFFRALRRLGKKVWMLQYEGEGHVLSESQNELDFTIRMKQFFDHYLKDAPAPKWMTREMPATMKGIDDGLELDTEIKTPGEGLLLQNKKIKL